MADLRCVLCSVLLAGVLLLVATSVVLLVQPTLLHTLKRVHRNVPRERQNGLELIAHRGGSGEHPEHTLAAYEAANSTSKFVRLHVEVRLSLDGVVVASADSNLFRLTGVKASVHLNNFTVLPPLLPTLPLEHDQSQTLDTSNQTLATLDEIMELLPDAFYLISVLQNNDTLVRKVHELIEKYNPQKDKVIWMGNDIEVGNKLYVMDEAIELANTPGQITRWIGLLLSGLLPFIPIRERHVFLLWPTGPFGKFKINEEKNKNHGIFFSLVATWDNESLQSICKRLYLHTYFVKHLHRRGIKIYLNGVESTSELKEVLSNYVVDGVMTNFPNRLAAQLA